MQAGLPCGQRNGNVPLNKLKDRDPDISACLLLLEPLFFFFLRYSKLCCLSFQSHTGARRRQKLRIRPHRSVSVLAGQVERSSAELLLPSQSQRELYFLRIFCSRRRQRFNKFNNGSLPCLGESVSPTASPPGPARVFHVFPATTVRVSALRLSPLIPPSQYLSWWKRGGGADFFFFCLSGDDPSALHCRCRGGGGACLRAKWLN